MVWTASKVVGHGELLSEVFIIVEDVGVLGGLEDEVLTAVEDPCVYLIDDEQVSVFQIPLTTDLFWHGCFPFCAIWSVLLGAGLRKVLLSPLAVGVDEHWFVVEVENELEN